MRDFGIERRFTAPAGKKFVHGARIKQRAGKRMLAEFTGLLQHIDVFLAQRRIRMAAIVTIDQLRQAQRAGQPGGAAANNGYVRLHLRTLNTFKRFSEDNHPFSLSFAVSTVSTATTLI